MIKLKHLLKEFKHTLLSAISPGDRFRFVASPGLLWYMPVSYPVRIINCYSFSNCFD